VAYSAWVRSGTGQAYVAVVPRLAHCCMGPLLPWPPTCSVLLLCLSVTTYLYILYANTSPMVAKLSP
jgi:hypothetical protein